MPAVSPSSPFPSLVIRAGGYEARGAFAQAQAMFLEPDPEVVRKLRERLDAVSAGVVAHFYMDAELQGVLAALESPRVHIADSLMMAERAVKMAEGGAKVIFVLGVDFMSENVRAALDASGYPDVPVYRVAEREIGCSLAEAAESAAYAAYVEKASRTPHSLHVIYVNTSLRVKGEAQKRLPTITCTSSNVLSVVLEAFATVPDLHVWFGPDTYMGHNLATMLRAYAELPNDAIARLHPAHTRASIASAAQRFHWFEQGACVVHHMFGSEVTERVRRDYADAFVTAHLEVPGEMFALGFEAQRAGRGVVGSTSNILDFILATVKRAGTANGVPATDLSERARSTLKFVLGTESGMATSVARAVRETLEQIAGDGGPALTVEIVFPVASEAIAQTGDSELPIIPGVTSGEGCSTAGGCASCVYMKMSSLDGLEDALDRLVANAQSLTPIAQSQLMARYAPKRLTDPRVATLGGETIGAMRELQRTRKLPPDLVAALT
jgi:quinolinate synthase